MENNSAMEMEAMPEENLTSNPFTFSKPNIIPNPTIHFGLGSEHVFDVHSSQKNIFTFAAPTTVSPQHSKPDKFKPRRSRDTTKASANVFAQALKNTSAFQQLKRNSRSQAIKEDIENSITCTKVPQELLTKNSAKEYFMTYGNTLKVTIRPKKKIITVFYSTKEEATRAYYSSGEYLGKTFNVEWTKSIKSPTKKKESNKNLVTNLLKATDDEIKSEIEALTSLEYNLPDDSRIGGSSEMSLFNLKRSKNYQIGALKHERPREKPAVKNEKTESDSQIPMLLPTTPVDVLQNIIQQAAFTSEDKFKVLEARDRLMRLRQVKSHSLATAEITSGTCPDMCPEKERLMRESQRQVSLYEQLEGTEYRINHAIAVKQYSRSSANQEEPMPHELRPIKSLKMTMSYLLHEIVDLCEQEGTNLAEWYHFMWDRTRGIRKDITQQELCCKDSVELVEQCARFHIVCSERLCAEEPSVFDKKINTENLTKCLQSLKYMYHDLRIKGIVCKNEPEFWAYIILLNLNNGSFMGDLQRLPTAIQRSKEVQFAIDVYSALQSNNYYKFFNLVRNTTYLNACILLRYFNQVRVRALSVMVKAYCRTMSTPYPLYELIDILGFEDENEAIYFCDQVRLNVSNDDLHVLLNRQNFCLPLSNIEQSRAHNLVESKRTSYQLSIGRCIAGDSMPEKIYTSHKPHNSFDAQGHLVQEALNAEDQNMNKTDKKSDIYEFVDEEMPESIQNIPKYESNRDTSAQNIFSSIKPVETSTQLETHPVTSSTFKTPATFSSTTSIFGANKTDNVFHKSKSFGQTIENKFGKDERDHGDTSEQFGKSTKNLPFDTLQQKTVTSNKQTESFSFTNIPKNPFTSQPSTIFAKPSGVPHSFATSTPFATVNKSIFAHASQGNIFSKSSSSPTIFAGSQVKTPITSDIFASAQKPIDHKRMPVPPLKKLQEPSKQEKSITAEKEMKSTVSTDNLESQEELKCKTMQEIEAEASSVFNDIEMQVVEDLCSNIAREEMNRIKMYNTITENIFDEILNQVSYEICDSVLSEEVENRRKIQEVVERLRMKILLKCFNAWKQYVQKRKQQREALSDTPVWLQKYSIDTCANLLYDPEQEIVIRNMRKRNVKEDFQTLEQSHSQLAPIEIIIYAGIKENLKSLEMNTTPTSFWKLVISWPNLENKTVLWRHKKIMNRYLCPENYTTEPIIKTYQSNTYETLHICIRHFEDLISDHNLIGTDALLFIASAEEDIKSTLRRLTKCILSREKLMPIPVVFLVLGGDCAEYENEKIVSELEMFVESGYISEYTIAYEKNLSEQTILSLTQSTILWLSINKSMQNPLEMDYLQNVYDTCLTEELWLRIMGDLSFNSKISQALKDPNVIINLHNEAVTHLMDIISDPESLMYTKFAPELKKFLKPQQTVPLSYEYFDDSWKRGDYRAQVDSAMNKFVLPEWRAPWPISDPKVFHEHMTRYCREVLSHSNGNTLACNILSKIFLSTGNLDVTNFIDILLYIFKEKLYIMPEELKVVYNRNHIKHFRTLPWWFKSRVITDLISQEKMDVSGNENIEPVSKKQRKMYNEYRTPINQYDALAEFCADTQKKVMEVHCTSKKLEDQLEAQKLQNQLLEEKLRSALFMSN